MRCADFRAGPLGAGVSPCRPARSGLNPTLSKLDAALRTKFFPLTTIADFRRLEVAKLFRPHTRFSLHIALEREPNHSDVLLFDHAASTLFISWL